MTVKRAYLLELPGEPNFAYLQAALRLAPDWPSADVLALPALTAGAVPLLTRALGEGRPAYLPAEALPQSVERPLRESLSALTRKGLTICPLTELPRWVETGANYPGLLTLERLNALMGQGFDRIYLSAVPAATPLARNVARQRKIHLRGGIGHGTGEGDRLGLVHEEK